MTEISSDAQGENGKTDGFTYIPPLSFRMVGDMAPLFAAKAQARLDFRPIVKNRTVKVNPPNSASYTFDYATLDSVRDSCDEALATNGLDIFHAPADEADARVLRTFLTHASGAFLECVVVIPAIKQTKDGPKPLTIQEVGSAMTYWERYSYVALAGVASEHDDDGNAADGNEVQGMAPRDRTRPAPPPKPAGAPAATPRKPPAPPQDAPKVAEAPKAQPEPQSAPQAKSEPPPAPTTLLATADKLAEMKSLFVSLQFKGTPAKECVGLLTGKDAGKITNPDVEQVCLVLRAALANRWDADRLMLLVRETPEAEAAVRAIEGETAAMGGAS